MEVQLATFRTLLDEFKHLQPLNRPEPSIFSIGTQGYYENPTTDILAFFVDDNGPHQLGVTALTALFDCLPPEFHELDYSLVQTPEREVSTKAGKRIDLLLEGTNWVLVVENKIYHTQNNPFEHYQSFIQTEQAQRFANKTPIFVVLSPEGERAPDGWHAISYKMLISSLKVQLAEQFIAQPINKWSLFLREFILHLESLMSQPTVHQQAIEFILSNLKVIKDLQQVKQQAINEYHQYLKAALQTRFGQDIAIRLHSWGGDPALRFALSHWPDSPPDVVLHLSDNNTMTKVNVYAVLGPGVSELKADTFILTGQNAKRWIEGGGKYRGYCVEQPKMTNEQIIQFIYDRLLELDKLYQSANAKNI